MDENTQDIVKTSLKTVVAFALVAVFSLILAFNANPTFAIEFYSDLGFESRVYHYQTLLAERGSLKHKYESANLAIYSDYEYAGEKFRVYNCHFESYNVSVSGLMRGLVQRDSVLISTTGDKMKRSITRRPKQVDMVFEHIEKCPLETFVCGDFNDNPMSYTYYRMTRGRKDTFKEAGNGFGASFAAMWPMLRIDYILCPEKYNPISHKTPRVPYSDHYPVVAQLAL
jgi:endonuclease/exonuclease/phosphatase family metal-dependent hydrolase